MKKQKKNIHGFKWRKIGEREVHWLVAMFNKLTLSARGKQIFKVTAITMGTVLLMAVVYFKNETGRWFMASIIEAPQPFNGTVMPVSKVPNWSKWKGDAKTARYSDISPGDLIDMPKYDLAQLQVSNDSLKWGNASDDVIRNAKITYSVVYLGNYDLDHQEGVGSHLAIDIKMPQGTPVHAIANGQVVSVSMTSSGFGHHLVIMHPNVPDPENPGQLTTLYSAYNHLDEIRVSEGQNVMKGDVVATSGNTGTSTTPHLHFQLDRDSAPFHPYWAFTSADSQKAGLSFFDSINAGLGLEKAKMYTVNPMKFVYANFNTVSVASAGNPVVSNPAATTPSTNPAPTPTPEPTPAPTPADPGIQVVEDPHANQPTVDPAAVDPDLFTFKLEGETVGMLNNGVVINATDERGQVTKMSPTDEIRAELAGVGQLMKKSFTKSDFNGSNSVQLIVKSDTAGVANIQFGKSSVQITFVDQVRPAVKLKIVTDGFYQKDIPENVKIVAVDENGATVPAVNFSGAVTVQTTDGDAVIAPETLSASDFKAGIAKIRVTVSNENPVTLRAQNGALVSDNTTLAAESKQFFTDVTMGNVHYKAIKWLKDNDIVSGYSDGSFKPNQTVNRVEALKMLMLAFGLQAGPGEKLPFSDTQDSAWYAQVVSTALSKNIVAGYADGSFKPSQTVNKAEYLKILFKTNAMEFTDELTANPYADVPAGAWYAPYAYLANRKNLIDVIDSKLNPTAGMTRAEVAETIYRLKMIQQNGWVAFSK